MTRSVLVVGAPRSGTTWVAQILSAAAGADYVEEPDNHFRFAFAYTAKRRLGLGPYPRLDSRESSPQAAAYERLWREAFEPVDLPRTRVAARSAANRLVRTAGSRRVARALAGEARGAMLRVAEAMAVPEQTVGEGRPLVVKSVFAPFSAEWIAARHDVATVVVLRDPLSVVSSWLALGWLDPAGPEPLAAVPDALAEELGERFGAPCPPSSWLARTAWLIGVLTCALEEAVRRNPSWTRVVHEELYIAPHDTFPSIASAAGLAWSAAGDSALDRANRPGKGYETTRATRDLRDSWRRRLDDTQVEEIVAALQGLPLEHLGPRPRDVVDPRTG